MELHDILLAADVVEYRFPPKNFINLLNYNDCDVDKQIYTADSLELEPQDSRARHEKVWIVIDENNSLKRCNHYAIPKDLFEEYKNMPDYTLMDNVTDSPSS